ncbi:uncharacterized protein cno isoform X4 [Epargyreus clarus]|uniref:uncharacterized protein cno isoform X4 n=1 Tax=Epargyreus clarus TaxID=520877 RepID=UPI003C302061
MLYNRSLGSRLRCGKKEIVLGSIMFHVRRRPTDSQPRRRKKKAGAGAGSARPGNEPMLLEVAPDGSTLENGRRLRITDIVEVGSGNGTALQLYGPSIQPRHCVLAAEGGGCSVTPLHADAHVYVNGRRVMHTQRLQHGCLLKFGRVSTFRFVDPAQENLMNRNLSQSQHFGSGSIYDRSPTSGGENSGAMSPTSLASHQPDPYDSNANANEPDYPRTISPVSHDTYGYNANDTIPPYNNNTLKLDNESLMMSQHLNDSKDDYIRDEHSGSVYNDQDQSATGNRIANSQYKDNYETTFDLDGNVETKSICSAKSGGSGHDSRLNAMASSARPGLEPILPAVLEFPEAGQAQFLAAVITRLDPHAPAFKLAPVYTLYLCARYRASTHYRPELTPTERAHKLTAFLHHVATLIHATVQERCTDSAAQAFWMANASELLHFLKCDRHISSFSTQAQDLLPTTVQNAFSNLVSCFQEELSRALGELTRDAGAADATDATAPTLQALAAAMVLLRRCRVNAALTIQLFSHLFHYINAVCFNKLVTEPGSVNARWGAALSARLALLAAWAERQGLELAADCHLARTHQAARLIQGEYRTAEEARAALEGCCKLNSVQVRALLAPLAAPDALDAAVAHTRASTDELYRADGREIRLEESMWLGAALLIPGDGFSAEVVRGVPPGLAEFVAPLQRGGLCRLAHQPHALGLWTVYLAARARRPPHDPRPALVQLHKNANGMGLSIVAAKGAGQSKLGIYIKSVVPGGAAAADGRLAAGDQLLSVDGHSLVGITQEKAAEYLVRTGPTVTLEVAKQGAVLHGLATLLHQPAYNQRQASGAAGGAGGAGALRRASERDLPARLAAEPVKPSKSTPALHHAAPPLAAPHAPHTPPHATPAALAALASPPSGGSAGGGGAAGSWAHKSRSSHNLAAHPPDAFYQNLAAVHSQHRWSSLRSSSGSNRPQSAHFSATAESQAESPAAVHHQTNQSSAANARAAKLAEMSEEVSRRQQQQQQLQQQHQQQMHQQQLHQQQMQQQQMLLGQQKAMSQQQLSQSQLHIAAQQYGHTPPQPYHNQHQPQRYEWHPSGPPSPQRSQPPVAPKPMGTRKPETELDEQHHLQQHSQMHNSSIIQPTEDERYVASASEPPAVSMYPAGGAGGGAGGGRPAAAHNPWQREERERQAEARRAQARARRDAAIAQLLSLGAARTPVQNQQLRALQLERDFERRATQHDHDDGGNAEAEPDEEDTSPPPSPPAVPSTHFVHAPHTTYNQHSQHASHVINTTYASHAAHAPHAAHVHAAQAPPPAHAPPPAQAPPPSHAAPLEDMRAPPHPPKSILKTNSRPEVTNGYAPENNIEESRVSEVTSSMASAMVSSAVSTASVAASGAAGSGPPAPPERGSSFAVMAGRHLHAAHQQEAAVPPQSPVGAARDKRVSFHERAAAAPASPAPPAPPASSPPPLDAPLDAAHEPPAREDPDRFIEEAENMLAGPISPGAAVSSAAVTHTPGVIGAQEVYRDPRARRLAEAQARAPAAPVPEHLSFKEKMKMFALESGEASTPKDKVKISRAQRDIDAVH